MACTPRYSRRHYVDVAQILRAERFGLTRFLKGRERTGAGDLLEYIQGDFERLFRDDNRRFDLDRFRRAATGEGAAPRPRAAATGEGGE